MLKSLQNKTSFWFFFFFFLIPEKTLELLHLQDTLFHLYRQWILPEGSFALSIAEWTISSLPVFCEHMNLKLVR